VLVGKVYVDARDIRGVLKLPTHGMWVIWLDDGYVLLCFGRSWLGVEVKVSLL
jgi:hypothetical protein